MGVITKIREFIGIAKGVVNQPVNRFISLTKASDLFASYSKDVGTDKQALLEGYTNPYFFTIIHDLAERMSELPADYFDYEGEYLPIPSTLQKLIYKPNDNENWSVFLYKLFANALLGEVYIFSKSATLGIENIPFGDLICPISFCVEPTYSSGGDIDYYTVNYRGVTYTVPYAKMLHIRTPCLFDGHHYDKGFGVGRAAKPIYEASNSQLGTKRGAFGNAGANKLISTASPENPMMSSERKAVQERLDNLVLGHDKVGRPIVVSTSMQVLDIGFKPKDYTFPEMQEMDIQAASMMFGVAPELYGSTKSSSYNNKSEAEKARLKMIVRKADKIYKEISVWLIEQAMLMMEEKSCLKVDKTRIPELNTPNLEYLEVAKDIASQFNRGELSARQARAMLSEFDYSDAQLDDLLTKEEIRNEQENTE